MYSNPTTSLPPGFRFHPTDEELILHYLRNRAAAPPCPVSIIAEVDIYKFNPWELPAQATFGDREWYFFSPRDRKYPNGVRPNRAAGSGYWKATGTDKPIAADSGGGGVEESGSSINISIGVKKALVFYTGRPPKGRKTDWIMHEYRLAEAGHTNTYRPLKLRDHSMRLDDWVLCRIYKKTNHLPSTVTPPTDDDYYASGVAQEEAPMKVEKSFSISELFGDLQDYPAAANNCNLLQFDAVQPELPGFDYTSLMAAPTFVGPNQLFGGGCGENTSNSCTQTPKRQRINIGGGYMMSEPCFVPNLSNQFDSSQYGLLINQQQMLLNSHLGSH